MDNTMSPRKKPQKPDSHSNSKIARKNLEKWLPEEWNFARNVDDDDSGYEWGEDWRVEIVEAGQATGAKFSIQSKVLDSKDAVNSNGIGTAIDISTINRLFDIVYPVLIHFVHKKKQKSYVMWLEDWMAQQEDLSWRDKEDGTITIRIPLSKETLLNKRKIDQIRDHVFFHSLRHGNFEVVDLINRTSKDHRIEIIGNSNGITMIVHPLHDKAIPQIALLDEQAVQSFQTIVDTGLPSSVSGKLAFGNLPPLLVQQMEDLELTQVVAGFSNETSKTLIFSLELMDGDQNSLYKIEQIGRLP